MSSFWRFTLLGLCGALGIGLALCVAMSGSSVVESSRNDAQDSSAPTATTVAQGEASRGTQSPAHTPTVLHAAAGSSSLERYRGGSSGQPQFESIAPAIAQQSSFGDSALERDLLLAQAATNSDPLSGLPSVSQFTQPQVMEQLRQQLQRAMSNGNSPQLNVNAPPNSAGTNSAGAAGSSPSSNELPPGNSAAAPPKSKPRITRIPGEGDNNLAIHIQDSDLRDVLQLLSEQGGLNILPSPSVQGKVSASLTGVDVDTALAAILRSTGFIAKHDGKFIYVGTPQDFKTMDQSQDRIGTRVYHLNYVRASDINSLVTPLLTPGVGTISVTAPANEGIAADSSKVGGDQYAGGDSVLVHDYVCILDQIEQVIAEIDRKPAQVAIEAMILKVTLDDKNSFGIDFAFLRDNPHVHLFTGSPLNDLASLKPNGGLQFGFLDGSTAAFLSALETIGDTNIIASPHLMVIDKARAEILIGNQDGYVNSTITETSTAQNVQFLETGAQLRLRPFISNDGMVRMEVHPELSTGNVEVTTGPNPLTLPHKDVTQVTTNIIVPDGCTVIIGGLMREELDTTTSQVPFFGSLPGVGFLFRHKDESTHKKEIVVLITPHIVCDSTACCEGDKAAAEFHRREAVYADQMSPLGKRFLGRKFYRLAQTAWAKGDQKTALRFADLSVHFDPESRAAINLRTDIWNGNLTGDHTLLHPSLVPPGGELPIGSPPTQFGPPDPDMPEDLPPTASPAPNLEPVPAGPTVPMDAHRQAPGNKAIEVRSIETIKSATPETGLAAQIKSGRAGHRQCLRQTNSECQVDQWRRRRCQIARLHCRTGATTAGAFGGDAEHSGPAAGANDGTGSEISAGSAADDQDRCAAEHAGWQSLARLDARWFEANRARVAATVACDRCCLARYVQVMWNGVAAMHRNFIEIVFTGSPPWLVRGNSVIRNAIHWLRMVVAVSKKCRPKSGQRHRAAACQSQRTGCPRF